MFRGNHPAKIDEKGRLKVPAAFKTQLDAAHVTEFYVTSTTGMSAEIWPLVEWEKVENRLDGASALNEPVKNFMKLVNFYGQQAEMDNQGRLLLPQILRTRAKLDAEVTVIGMRTYLEVHNLEIFEQGLPPNGLSDEHRVAVDAIIRGQG